MRWTALALVGFLASGVACDKGAPQATGDKARRPLATQPDPATNGAPSQEAAAEDSGQAAGGVSGAEANAEVYAYDDTGKRDPFRSFVLEHALKLADTERGPLEQFDLNQLTVVAVVWGTERPRALVADPSGRGYVIQEGTAIGKNEGRVIQIDDNLVLVRETYVDYLGDRTMKEVEMQVRQSQGG